MATYDYTRGGTTGLPAVRSGKVSIIERFLDFAAIAAARSAASLAALASADVIQIIQIPAMTHVLAVYAQTGTVEGATATMGIGDGSGTSGFISAYDLNATTFGSSLITSTYSVATAGGKVYTVADTIDGILNNSSIDVATVRVWAVCIAIQSEESKGT